MKFKIQSNDLLKVYKLTEGFRSQRLVRPILTAVHIVCDTENQQTLFECTNSMKVVRWTIKTNVIEEGECAIKFSKTFLYLLKTIKNAIPFEVIIYEENGVVKADIDGNIIKLEKVKGDYPNIDSVYSNRPETYDNEPILDIAQLEQALKSMQMAGADSVKLSIPTKEYKTVKLTADTHFHEPIVAVIATQRRM